MAVRSVERAHRAGALAAWPGSRPRRRPRRRGGAQPARRRRGPDLHQGRIRQAAGAVARHRAVARRSAGAAGDRGARRSGQRARSCRTAPPRHRGCAQRDGRRPSCLDRADALDDRRHGVRRHRRARPCHRRHRHLGIVRHPRGDGGQPADRRSAAFRRRQRQLHRQPVLPPLPAARPAGRADRRRRCDLRVRLFGVGRDVVFRHAGRRPVRGAARHLLAAPDRLSGAGRHGGVDRRHHRFGLAPYAVQHAELDRMSRR
uniref:Uncharacterized protein n=1 Tax=Rhodopseudomonas palustris (strain ATCC BAA-98 / CGA009) TaxID=258594 RepID=Q6N0M7_RHOPA|nr:hypothetical protein RPA4735 [Rhodopseudomonas palustris CGA009]